MNTKLLMQASAIFLGLLGILCQFLPTEILTSLGTEVNLLNKLVLQIGGALYVGFGMLNWMGKNNIIGGVYSRPVAVANLAHFGIGAITLTKTVFSANNTFIIVLTTVYVIFALSFTKIVFTHPSKD